MERGGAGIREGLVVVVVVVGERGVLSYCQQQLECDKGRERLSPDQARVLLLLLLSAPD